MPWDAIVGSASGSAVVLILGLWLAQKWLDNQIRTAQAQLESSLRRAEEVYEARVQHTFSVDTDLRERRIKVYAPLWRLTGILPLWPRNDELEYRHLKSLSRDLREWYFESGGMYLSTEARTAYGAVQKSLKSIYSRSDVERVSEDDYDRIQDKCSTLRSRMTDDLLSRRSAVEVVHAPEEDPMFVMPPPSA
jgi:hypothetical protein